MNQEKLLSRLVNITGSSRKEVIDVLRIMSAMPEVQKELKRQRHHDKKR